MVRYIKDGAYTIVVEDVGGEEGEENGGGEESVGDHSRPSIESRHKIKSKHQLEEELDKIDYTSPDFILQNLKLAFPKYEDDDTFALLARKELMEIIVEQICFYTYCVLQAFIHNPTAPTILFFGDGTIGCKVIEALGEFGCKPLLRIYSRGEFSTPEWTARGYQASSNLPNLMGTNKADLVIICSEYSSFQMIYRMLRDLELIADTTAVITSTLGFQRKRLYYNFGIPTVFRTYVEPQRVQKTLKMNQIAALDGSLHTGDSEEKKDYNKPSLAHQPTGTTTIIHSIKEDPEEEMLHLTDELEPTSTRNTTSRTSVQTPENTKHPPLDTTDTRPTTSTATNSLNDKESQEKSHSHGENEKDDDDDENSSINSSTTSLGNLSISKIQEEKLSIPEKAAYLIFQRTRDMKNILYILENYYAIHGFSFADARYLALRSIFGYIDPKKKGIPKKLIPNEPPKKNSPRKRQLVEVNFLEQILLFMFTQRMQTFQQFFSRLLTIQELMKLTDTSNLGVIEGSLVSSNQPQHPPPSAQLSAQSSRRNTARSNSPNHDFFNQQTRPQSRAKDLYSGDEDPSKLKYLRMHDSNIINQIFEFDDDYRLRSGPGFEFMRILDNRENKKISMNTLLQRPALKYLFESLEREKKGIRTNSFVINENLLPSEEPGVIQETMISGSHSIRSNGSKGGFDPFALPRELTLAEVGSMGISMEHRQDFPSLSVDTTESQELPRDLDSNSLVDHQVSELATPSLEENARRRKEKYREKMKTLSSPSSDLSKPLGASSNK